MSASTLSELLQLERWLEEGFRAGLVLQNVIVLDAIDISRQSSVANSPRIELKAIIGEVARHQHVLRGGTVATWDTFSGELECLIVTNRQSVEGTNTHYNLIGKLRACLMPIYRMSGANNNPIEWWSNTAFVQLTDIRGAGTEDSWSDDKNLDYTKLKFALLFNISQAAWPTT